MLAASIVMGGVGRGGEEGVLRGKRRGIFMSASTKAAVHLGTENTDFEKVKLLFDIPQN